MILLPSRCIAARQRAVTVHHIDLDVFSDWIEASVMVEATDISRTDVIDLLLEEDLYETQDLATEIVDSAWSEIERRISLCRAAYGVSVDGEWIRPVGNWTGRVAHAFCLILSLATKYDWWYTQFGNNYLEQGRLFEALTEHSLSALSPGWTTFRTGWTGEDSSRSIQIAQEVADQITGEPIIKPEWRTDRAKDFSLDILFYLPFADGRQGRPYFLIQCASGGNWDSQKLKEPDIDLWRKLLNPDILPVRGISVPFCLANNRFKPASSSCAGLFLDRCRLLSAADKIADWLPKDVEGEIQVWLKTRIACLLQRSK